MQDKYILDVYVYQVLGNKIILLKLGLWYFYFNLKPDITEQAWVLFGICFPSMILQFNFIIITLKLDLF